MTPDGINETRRAVSSEPGATLCCWRNPPGRHKVTFAFSGDRDDSPWSLRAVDDALILDRAHFP